MKDRTNPETFRHVWLYRITQRDASYPALPRAAGTEFTMDFGLIRAFLDHQSE